ncbi:immunoglobulin superfamily member 5 [Tachysurus fulvidraco]|uniref:immunoglobulin superfamily member 5 n=1 Tax=Tachysurus fulvidraco TaxID=1234273 RepID=UPI000F517503|nr:immunoglobulin superfamily member 5 [Tachysurus fulvidraco]
MDTFTLAAILLFFTGSVSAQVLVPLNTTVLLNSNARFNCSVSTSGWVAMTWTVNGRLALIVSEQSGPLVSDANYTATNYTTVGQYKWEFLMKNVTTASAGIVGCQIQNNLPVNAVLTVQQSGTVVITGSNRTATQGDQVTFQCMASNWSPAAQISWAVNGTLVDKGQYNTSSVANGALMNSSSNLTITATTNVSVDCLASISTLPSPAISTVFLTVQKAVPPTPRDQTVLIAITVAFSLAALLALLIILIVFCCKRQRKKRSRYQEEVRARSLSQRQQATYARRGRGQENLGYVEEAPSVDNRDGVYTIGGFQRDNIQVHAVNSTRYGDDLSYGDGYSFNGLQKHRHLTIV